MKKIILSSSLLLMTSSLMAFDVSKIYVGAGASVGSGETTSDYSYTSSNGSAKFDSSSLYFKIGYKLENDNRFEITPEIIYHDFSNATVWGTKEDTLSALSFDWSFTYPIKNFIPYWTIGFGTAAYDDTERYFIDNAEDLAGFAINYGVGFLYNINKTIDLEIAYRIKSISWESYTNSAGSVELNSDWSSLYFGLNYNFN